MRLIRRATLLFILLVASCNVLAQPTATPTATQTATPTETVTSSPTITPSPTTTPTATLTSTITRTPTATPTSTNTPLPTTTPQPIVAFTSDNWELVDLPDNIRNGLGAPVIAFVNQNDQTTITNLATGEAPTNRQTLYYASPTNPAARVEILVLPASTGDQIYISPQGNGILYFVEDPAGTATGLYLLDGVSGVSSRILPIRSMIQRGILSEPAWSQDGAWVAITVATGYDMDIYIMRRDGTSLEDLVNQGSYDFWPAWSPDGRYLLFVSDRALCASWRPGEAGTCDGSNQLPPAGGHPYILDRATGRIEQVSTQWVTEPPKWLNSQRIAFAVGNPVLGDAERTIWTADVNTGQDHETRLVGGLPNQINVSESWSPDGNMVIFQNASDPSTEIVLTNRDGLAVGRTSDLIFPRFGMAAAWSPDGSRIAIGGVNGQCPYGSIVIDSSNFRFIARGNPPPGMCNPVFSSNGAYLAFWGVNPTRDGRLDVYVANNNGFGTVNLTGDLRGQTRFLGWVGG